MKDFLTVYRDERYVLGLQDDLPCLIADGRRFTLTCHPYEPCLYISDEEGRKTAVHNAFDPEYVLEAFGMGEIIQSITGRKYDACAFCRMVEYAAGLLNINIDDAEKVFETDTNPDTDEYCQASNDKEQKRDILSEITSFSETEEDCIIYDDPAFDVIDKYPDRAVEYCIVRNEYIADRKNAHRNALASASRELFFDGKELIWTYDCDKAVGKWIDIKTFFAPAFDRRGVNYRGAFLYPPYGVTYSEEDFDSVNTALFPNGTDSLEVCEWTTDWSEFFDEGHEWWGSLCFTVYDKSLDRFVVIMASATD